MILADVNVLVYAFRTIAPEHHAYRQWLHAQLENGVDEFALLPASLTGFLRLVTNARIFSAPAPMPVAVDFVQRLVRAPRTRWLGSERAVWERTEALLADDPTLRGNAVPDVHLAAAAMVHRCRLATADRGFARFPGLRWFEPVV